MYKAPEEKFDALDQSVATVSSSPPLHEIMSANILKFCCTYFLVGYNYFIVYYYRSHETIESSMEALPIMSKDCEEPINLLEQSFTSVSVSSPVHKKRRSIMKSDRALSSGTISIGSVVEIKKSSKTEEYGLPSHSRGIVLTLDSRSTITVEWELSESKTLTITKFPLSGVYLVQDY